MAEERSNNEERYRLTATTRRRKDEIRIWRAGLEHQARLFLRTPPFAPETNDSVRARTELCQYVVSGFSRTAAGPQSDRGALQFLPGCGIAHWRFVRCRCRSCARLTANVAHDDGRIVAPWRDMDAEIKQEFAVVRAEIREEAIATRRHFDVVAESLRDDIRLIAEGLIALDAKVEATRNSG